MHDPLAPLLVDGVIDEVVARLKSGKEADLWIVRHAGEAIAAKVYKSRQTRSFRNDAVYREGRQVRDTRTQRAMDRGSRFGQAAAEEAWKTKEADALHALHAAGVRVPRPVMFYEGVLLMELVLDAHGHPASRLIDARIAREDAAAMYADLRAQAVRMLGCDLIHGDLSPYNVLVGAHGPVVIDFPQVVGAAHNSQAESFFHRDLENLRRFFAAIDPALGAAAGDAREIWRAYVRRDLTADFVPTGREPPAPQRTGGGERAPHAKGGGQHAQPSGGGHPRERGAQERRGPRGEQHARPEPHPRAEQRHRGEQRAPAEQQQRGGPQQRGAPQQQRGAPQPQPQRGAPQQQRGAQQQRGEAPQRGAQQQQRAGPQRAPQQQPQRGPQQQRGGAERRRAAPTPEVVRVVRPPLPKAGAPGASASTVKHAPPGSSGATAHGAQPGPHGRSDDGRGPRRRPGGWSR